MAEQSEADRKSQLIAELERSRSEFARNVRGLRHDLDVGSHLKHAFVRQKSVWLAGAAVTGWILAKIPSRKKAAVSMNGASHSVTPTTKQSERAGIALTLLNLVLAVLKPAITAFATKKLKEYATEGLPKTPFRRTARR